MTEGRATVPARRAVGWGALVLALVAVVAMAAHGAAWSTQERADARSLPHSVVVGGAVLAAVLAAILLIAMVATTRSNETPEQRKRRWMTAIGFLVVIALLSIVRVAFFRTHPHAPSAATTPKARSEHTVSRSDHPKPADATWWPVVLVGLGAAAIFVSAVTRRSRLAIEGGPVADATLDLLGATIDELRSEPDPRRAVIAAYARMERGLAANGFARWVSETPTEYLRRALGTRAVEDRPIAIEPLRELTTLAERARFSTAPIDEAMRERAIAALEQIRTELRAPAEAFGMVS